MTGRHLSQLGQRRLLAQLFLHLYSAAEIVEDARELALALNGDLADRQVQRERRAVLAAALHYPSDADDLGSACREEVRHRMPQSAVVLMTAYGSPEVAEGALRLGAYRVVSKPFDMHEIDTLAREAYQALPRG